MERIVSAQEMKWCDDTTISDIGIPGRLLMENAGSAVARSVERVLGDAGSTHVVILCGKGNNGGDGFVVARHLSNAGSAVSVMLLAAPAELKGDALANFTVLKKLPGRSVPSLTIQRYTKNNLEALPKADAVVDAIFGTGFTGTVRKPASDVIGWINRQSAPVFAVDIPSGVNATSGAVENVAVRATHTVTFGLVKRGLLLSSGKEHAGIVERVDIGIPRIVTEAATLSKTFLLHPIDIKASLPRRPSTAHKYSVGKVLVVAGSKGLTGAAAMCATSALRAGAGAVVLAVPETVYPTMARKLTEVMVMPLPSTDAGTLSDQSYAALEEKLGWADVVAVGPGLSQHPQTQATILRILKDYRGRVVLDADGLNALASSGVDLLKKSKGEFVLTPHTGEFARLVKKPSADVERDRVEVSRALARRLGGTVVLKGAPTVTATPHGAVYINPTGNPGMATIGSGDVLTGIVAALWAQGCPAEVAATSGVYLHGLAGDLARNELGERSLLAGDLITYLSHAFTSIEQEQTK